MPQGSWPFWGVREPVSSGTHFVAFVWAIYATVLLCRLCRNSRLKQWSLGCYGISMIVLYAASCTYHGVMVPENRLQFYRLLDHSAIYGLIAGTYTPALAVLLTPSYRKWLL